MILCPNCGAENLVGVLFCEDCAELLHLTATLVPDEEAIWLGSLKTEQPYGIHEVGGALWLMIQPEIFYLHRGSLQNGQLILGRLDSNEEYSMLKLDTENIDDLGISRMHAAVMPVEGGVQVEDVGSTNGTRLNGQVLTRGRSYDVKHKDRVELGKLTLTLHFVSKESFLRATSQRILSRFSKQVQDVIGELDVSDDALAALAFRLPKKDELQLQVLSQFHDGGRPMTLQALHNAINGALGEGISGPLIQVEDGEKTATLKDGEEAVLETAGGQPKQKGKGNQSTAFLQIMTGLHMDGLQMEKRLMDYLERADTLPEEERFALVNSLNPMVTQLRAWLQTIDPANKSPRGTGTFDSEEKTAS